MGQAALPAALLGSGALGSIFAPEGQELSSFEGVDSDISPSSNARSLGRNLQSYLDLVLSEAGRPITAQTTVAPLSSFGGGGLPFDIAAPAVDPNRLDASRRTIPGLPVEDFFHRPPTPSDGSPPDPGGPWTPDEGSPISTTMPVPRSRGPAWPGSGEPVSRIMPVPNPNGPERPGLGLVDGSTNDLDQAEGAIALLMDQLQEADGGGGVGPRRRQLA